MRTLAVIALKGGSGKTTVAAHLALAAHLRGVAAMLVDVDPQASAHHILSARVGDGPDCLTSPGTKIMAAQFAAVGLKKDLLVIDTPAGVVEDVTEAIVLCDLAVMVVRPTLIDIAGLARTLAIVRRLGKPATVVVSQAPVAREGVEPPLVQRALKGLAYLEAPTAPVILRARTIYQTALETGRSAEEMSDRAAAREVAALWDYVAAAVALPQADAWPADPQADPAAAAPPPP